MTDNVAMSADIDFDRYDRIRPIRWTGDALELLDQRTLPFKVDYVACHSSDDVAAASHALTVRGAPAIGIAAAWGVVLAAGSIDAPDGAEAAHKLEPAMLRLNAARPTAVNLAWALAYNLIALPLAATGQVTPWMAALGMAGSSLLVTLNALRLARPGAA